VRLESPRIHGTEHGSPRIRCCCGRLRRQKPQSSVRQHGFPAYREAI
jgi:hypothetical protein